LEDGDRYRAALADRELGGAGWAMFVGGAWTSLFGLATWRASEDRAPYQRRNIGGSIFGMTLTGLGGGALVGSITSTIQTVYAGHGLWGTGAAVAFFGGAILLPVGAPLWAAGTRRTRGKKGHPPPTAAPGAENRLQDDTMMVAGIGLTASGATGLAVATGVNIDMASSSQHRRTTGAARLMTTLALGLPSAGLVAAGV